MRGMRAAVIALGVVLALAGRGLTQETGAGPGTLTLEVRVFNGSEEVTVHTKLTVHRAGDRSEPLVHVTATAGRAATKIPAGIYDVQAIHERDGRVLNIRWANRLVVMPYPDERGHHLEVVNFKNGFGALQVRTLDDTPPHVSLHEPGQPEKPVATAVAGPVYSLFVVPVGVYDLHVRTPGTGNWHRGIEVPLDRTRLWVLQ
jgi:hypothetical protein